jgi:tRNA pseudouridine38-40 synthase
VHRNDSSVRLRLDIGYDGTEFHGWAVQPGLRTVQGEIESALAVVLRLSETSLALTVGGRTDAGVHARGQVAHVDVPRELAAGLTEHRLNGVLRRGAPDIAVHAVREVPSAFDARFSALRRRYEYRVRDPRARRDPLTARFTADVSRPLDFALLQDASDELLGLNDFTSFCKAREGATAIRELIQFDWKRADDGVFAARLEADAFCHSMVRSLIGAVVATASGRIGITELVELREARARTSRFAVMPAHGLSLEEISYPADSDLAARAALTRAKRDPLEN